MIQFSGHLSGEAKAFLWKRHKKMDFASFFIGMLMLMPLVLFFSIKYAFWEGVIFYLVMILAITLLLFIPPSKSIVKKIEPIKIYTEDEYIICVTEVGTETARNMNEATKLIDAGSYYYLVFSYGQVSMDFVLQKDLLVEGSLEEFEKIFEGRLERLTSST